MTTIHFSNKNCNGNEEQRGKEKLLASRSECLALRIQKFKLGEKDR